MFIPNNSTVPKLQTAKDLQGDALLYYDAEMELMNLILLSIPNDIYNSVDACTSARDMWKRVERLMRGTIQNKVDRETHFTNEFDQFVTEPWEALVSVYNRFAQLMNDLERNDMHFLIVTINTKFLNSLQPEWLKYVTQVRLAKRLTMDTFDDLFDYLQLFEKLVNVSREKKLEKSHDPLALADKRAKHFSQQAQSQFIRDRDIILDLEKQRDKLDLEVKDYKRENEELQKTHLILKRQMSEKEDSYHDTVLDLEAKLKKNVDLILKIGNSLQGMFMLGPKPMSVYDQQLKHGLGYPNPYTLKQAISQCPKLYLASSLGHLEIPLNNCWTIDYEQINALYKDFVPQKDLSAEQTYFPSSFIPSDKTSNATPSIPVSMPSDSPLICELDKIRIFFQKLSELIQKNCKRASIFYTSPEEIQLNDFCQDQVKPIVNELQFYFEFSRTLFQRDIKEMKYVFESTESEL
ncbi:hypothetical protein Tco_1079276 [Tanacetum coccineum]|uniref:Uncharacterized protein n=1 Tax=Tanacetum coccineum TaxID=301880 RepID=A0ABQ5HSG8_9ASTR